MLIGRTRTRTSAGPVRSGVASLSTIRTPTNHLPIVRPVMAVLNQK